MTLPIPCPQGFRIIAHRGASAYAPENTAAAFRLAHEIGVNEVETDAQLTTDGEVVLCHDTDPGRAMATVPPSWRRWRGRSWLRWTWARGSRPTCTAASACGGLDDLFDRLWQTASPTMWS